MIEGDSAEHLPGDEPREEHCRANLRHKEVLRAMKIAPNRPPLHAHHGTRVAELAAGIGLRSARASRPMQAKPTA